MATYLRPSRLDEALAALAGGGLTVVAGGTDHYPSRVGKLSDEDIIDVTGIDGLRRIEDRGDHWRIGATVTWTDLVRAALPACFDGLKAAAREVGGVQIQNTGTLAGNLCNASPAADGIPCLMALDASVELASLSGSRVIEVAQFVEGNRRTGRRPDEMVTAILVPKPAGAAVATFLKLGARRYLVISIVMVAALLTRDAGGRIGAARIAVGSAAATARRLPGLEERLVGRPWSAGIADLVRVDDLNGLSPIDDVRATAAYRQDAGLTLVRRALATVGAAA